MVVWGTGKWPLLVEHGQGVGESQRRAEHSGMASVINGCPFRLKSLTSSPSPTLSIPLTLSIPTQLFCKDPSLLVEMRTLSKEETWCKTRQVGDSPVVQGVRLQASTAGGMGSVPGQGTKISHAMPPNKKDYTGGTALGHTSHLLSGPSAWEWFHFLWINRGKKSLHLGYRQTNSQIHPFIHCSQDL